MGYTIGEMAKKLGVAPSAIRYYDREGLLPFIERSEGGVRVFKDSDYEMLRVIGCLKASGMSLKDIRKFVLLTQDGDSSIDERLEIFRNQKALVEEQMKSLQDTLDTVNYKCWFYETAKRMGTTNLSEEIFQNEMPEELKFVRERMKNL